MIFCKQVCAALDEELTEAFDSLVENLRTSKKFLRKQEERLHRLETEAKTVLRTDMENLETMSAQLVFIERPNINPLVVASGEESDLDVKLAEMRAQITSIKRRRLALDEAAREAEQVIHSRLVQRCNEVIEVPQLVEISHQSKRLRHLSQCTQEATNAHGLVLGGTGQTTPLMTRYTLEELIDLERRGMPSRMELEQLLARLK